MARKEAKFPLDLKEAYKELLKFKASGGSVKQYKKMKSAELRKAEAAAADNQLVMRPAAPSNLATCIVATPEVERIQESRDVDASATPSNLATCAVSTPGVERIQENREVEASELEKRREMRECKRQADDNQFEDENTNNAKKVEVTPASQHEFTSIAWDQSEEGQTIEPASYSVQRAPQKPMLDFDLNLPPLPEFEF